MHSRLVQAPTLSKSQIKKKKKKEVERLLLEIKSVTSPNSGIASFWVDEYKKKLKKNKNSQEKCPIGEKKFQLNIIFRELEYLLWVNTKHKFISFDINTSNDRAQGLMNHKV